MQLSRGDATTFPSPATPCERRRLFLKPLLRSPIGELIFHTARRNLNASVGMVDGAGFDTCCPFWRAADTLESGNGVVRSRVPRSSRMLMSRPLSFRDMHTRHRFSD